MTRLTLAWLLTLLAVGLPTRGAEAQDPDASGDVLTGKTREQLVALLGRPAKAKFSDAGETLVYRLLRLEGGASADPDLVLVEVPGVGLIGRNLAESDPLGDRETTLEPTSVDEHGRTVPGGVSSSESRSITWKREDGKFVGPDRPHPSPTLRRIKLTLHLDGSGRVDGWSVDPKEKKKTSSDEN